MDPRTETTGTNPPPAFPMHPPRTLVLCFDGTADQYDAENTNVVKFFSLLKKDNNDVQLCYYQAGVGTYFAPGVVSPLFTWCAKIADEAVAWYLPEHVMDGYRFLMQSYTVGDKICLFGFSRGAYICRALAGMLNKVGLLSPNNMEQVNFAYRLYSSSKQSDVELAAGFKQTFCRSVPIEFLGVWDTVASVGIVYTKTLPFVSSNDSIKTFRQALSLDEHRAKFRPNLYSPPSTMNMMVRAIKDHNTTTTNLKSRKSPFTALNKRFRNKRQSRQHQSMEEHDAAGSGSADDGPSDSVDGVEKNNLGKQKDFVTNGKEVWFAGCHSDVGGGAVSDQTQYALANIPLRWMVREVMLCQCGIIFEDAALTRFGIPVSVFGDGDALRSAGPHIPDAGILPDPQIQIQSVGKPESHSGDSGMQLHEPDDSLFLPGSNQPIIPEGETGLEIDAQQPMDDELKKNWLWWLLEIVPTKYEWEMPDRKWVSSWSFHLGRGRCVPPDSQFHETVKLRMDNTALKYKPKAVYQTDSITFVN